MGLFDIFKKKKKEVSKVVEQEEIELTPEQQEAYYKWLNTDMNSEEYLKEEDEKRDKQELEEYYTFFNKLLSKRQPDGTIKLEHSDELDLEVICSKANMYISSDLTNLQTLKDRMKKGVKPTRDFGRYSDRVSKMNQLREYVKAFNSLIRTSTCKYNSFEEFCHTDIANFLVTAQKVAEKIVNEKPNELTGTIFSVKNAKREIDHFIQGEVAEIIDAVVFANDKWWTEKLNPQNYQKAEEQIYEYIKTSASEIESSYKVKKEKEQQLAEKITELESKLAVKEEVETIEETEEVKKGL